MVLYTTELEQSITQVPGHKIKKTIWCIIKKTEFRIKILIFESQSLDLLICNFEQASYPCEL